MVKEQPFAVAAFGIAAGAAIAALLPPTRAEQDALRPLGEAAADAAAASFDQIKDAASTTGDQLKDAVQRRGLSAEGIKDMAREATQTFSDKLGGKWRSRAASDDGTLGRFDVMTASPDLDVLERDLQETRERLARDLDRLRSTETISGFKADLLAQASETKDQLVEKAKESVTAGTGRPLV